jgi:RND superfamily putative drug exporter
LRRLAIFVVHRRWWVIGVALLFLPLAAFYGGDVHSKLSSGGFDDPASESAKAAGLLAERFPQAAQSDFVLVVTAERGTVDDADVAASGQELTRRLAAADGVAGAISYWSLDNAPPLRSKDSSQALVVASLEGTDNDKILRSADLEEEFTGRQGALQAVATGKAQLTREISEQAEKDLQRSELFSAPLTFIALIIVFGSLVAALLPLGVGILAVIGTLALLTMLTTFTDVSVFALNLTTALGLGLAIDYSLFVVSRYREELAGGVSSPVAVGRTMQTAGRTVVFSAGTVAISLSALLLFPVSYVRSFAYAGVTVVAFAALASVVVLPAVLAALGPRIEKGRVFKVRDDAGGFWKAQANRVMRHPIPYALTVTLALLALAIPFLHLNLGLSDDRVVPDSVAGRAATDQIRENFSSRESDALAIVAPDVDADASASEVDRFARAVAAVPGIARVDALTGYYLVTDGEVSKVPPNDLSERFAPGPGARGAYLSAVPDVEPLSSEGERVVDDLRAIPAPFEFLVSGPSARLVDTKAMVADRLPWALGAIALVTFILLFLMTGSILVPIKALLLNMLSLTATFGAMVWIFQDGNLSGVLGFTPTGGIDVFTPILMFCIAFGLSMDYEVFLLSRIKEEYDLERDNERAVAIGLQKTGRIVTAAALLLTLVFLGIATSDVAVLKAFGVGLTLAVLVDAFLIRATLVPAFMRLAGRLNWWSPRAVRRWHLRYGIWENEPIAVLDREFEART